MRVLKDVRNFREGDGRKVFISGVAVNFREQTVWASIICEVVLERSFPS